MEERSNILTVLKAQSGDRRALDDLYRSVQAELFRCIFRIVGHREIAEDVLQEVFLIVYRKLRFLREPAHFRAWCFRIASRESMRASNRERKRRRLMSDTEPEALPDRAPDEEAEFANIEHVVRLLPTVPPASRCVLVLHYTESFTLPEVAGILGIPLGTVKSRLAYGLNLLRRELESPQNTTP